MSTLVHNLMQQYAVICIAKEPQAERFVLAYSSEKTLCDLLAQPSILSLGHSSRKEALATFDPYAQTGHASRQHGTAASIDTGNRSLVQLNARQRLSWCGSNLAKRLRFIRDLLQHGVVAAVAFYHSNNLFSVAIRVLTSS